MHLTILTTDKKVFEGEVATAKFPGDQGPFQVLQGHVPLISTLSKGTIFYTDSTGDYTVAIEKGVVEVLNDKMIVLAEKVY